MPASLITLLHKAVSSAKKRLVSLGARAIPRDRLPFMADVMLDSLRQDPAPSAAVLQGLFFGRVAPPSAERMRFEAPTLVIGHPRDPIHPFSDADGLAHEMPNARLLERVTSPESRAAPESLGASLTRGRSTAADGSGGASSRTAVWSSNRPP